MVPCESDAAVTASIRHRRIGHCGNHGLDMVKIQEGGVCNGIF